jgi:hypothetical protein
VLLVAEVLDINEGNDFLFIVNLFQITEILRAMELCKVGVAEKLDIVKSIVFG